MKKTTWILVMALACVAGGFVGFYTTHQQKLDQAFERGRAEGLRQCAEPSRLEKAAEWLAK